MPETFLKFAIKSLFYKIYKNLLHILLYIMRVYRKVTTNDLFGTSANSSQKNSKNIHINKVDIQKHQREYGAKKFIKP